MQKSIVASHSMDPLYLPDVGDGPRVSFHPIAHMLESWLGRAALVDEHDYMRVVPNELQLARDLLADYEARLKERYYLTHPSERPSI